MASRSEQTKRDWERQILSRKQIQLLSPMRIEYLDGDNSSSQTFRLKQHAEFIFAVYELYDGTNLLTPMSGRVLKEVAALSAEARGYTFTKGNLLTFGDGADGYKPPDSSSNKPGLMVVYRGASEHEDVTTVTWTTQVIADNVSDDSDTAIYVDGATKVSILLDSDLATTGAPNFDLDVIGSLDGTVYQDAAYPAITPFVAQAKAVEDMADIDVHAWEYIKLLLDVNTANLASTESVTATVRVLWKY